MSYQNESNLLFQTWQNAIPMYKKNFIRDGIINEDYYNKSNPKILFLMKEANDPSSESEWDLAKDFNERMINNFPRRIAEWSWGISNGFQPLDKITDDTLLHNSLKMVAILNVKKSGGGSSTDLEILREHMKVNKEFIKRQINIIDPDIIIGGLGQTKHWGLLIEDINWVDSGYDIKIARWGKKKLIDFYHPSYRVARAMSYSLLKEIFVSKPFSTL